MWCIYYYFITNNIRVFPYNITIDIEMLLANLRTQGVAFLGEYFLDYRVSFLNSYANIFPSFS